MTDETNTETSGKKQCPECGGDSVYYLTDGELGLEARRCVECKHTFWWNGQRVVEESEVSIG